MTSTVVTEWVGHSPANTVEKRVQWRRQERGGRVEYGVRGYKGVATRQVRTEVDGRVTRRVQQYERCGCFHHKRSAALKCGKWLAGRLNARPDLIDPKNRLPEETEHG